MNADFASQRIKMVDGQLRTTDVTNTSILDAMGAVAREMFVPAALRELAYIDEDMRVSGSRGQGARYLMEPSPLAKLIQLAEIASTDRVLDVGCATGYTAAVLSRLAASVVALDSDPDLAATAATTLSSLGCDNVAVVTGTLSLGYPSSGPYDVILFGGSVGRLPETLFSQLAEGGRVVVVEGSGNAGRARVYLKSDGLVTGRNAFNAAIKSLPGFELTHAFEF